MGRHLISKKLVAMDATKILQADFIDLLFDGRNKLYGAYELRRHYNRRLLFAMLIAAAMVAIVAAVVLVGNKPLVTETLFVIPPENALTELSEKREEIKPPTVAQKPLPAIETVRNTTITVVPDIDVPDEAVPPENASIEKASIGAFNLKGMAPDEIVSPPAEVAGTGQAVVPQTDALMDNIVYTTVETVAQFPGGASGWRRFLERNLQYPYAAIEAGLEAVIRVQFVIDTVGSISEVKALNDPGHGLAEEAVRIISKGPKWRPAEQNGNKVKYRHVQSIAFRLQ